ncbi:MAG TPA: sulfite exporter TauE/SafE family protein [Solirubrobacteraceae bacterium]|nr:sulfite exporter TauE/SafE family protein [Solirubrobacteraceae bacterium]
MIAVDPGLVAFGFAVGLLVGMTGIGGGSLMTPLLILVFGVKPVIAVGTDLAYGALTKTLGGYKHWRQRTVDARLSGWMALGSVPAAIGGVWVLDALQRSHGGNIDGLLLKILAGALLVTGAATLARALFLKQLVARERAEIRLGRGQKAAAVVLGAAVGFVLGLTSAGSGALIAVGLILVFQLVPTRVVGTDVFHAAILLWAAALAHLVAGNVDFGLAATILLGSLPGVWIGSHCSTRVPTGALRTTLAVLLIGSGFALLSKTGVAVPALALAAVPLLVAAIVVAAVHGERRKRRPAPEPPAVPWAGALRQEP